MSQRWVTPVRPSTPQERTGRDMRGELPPGEFRARCEEVYWHKAPACSAKGPRTARCVRFPGHAGVHEGNGNDGYGPIYYAWTDKKKARAARVG